MVTATSRDILSRVKSALHYHPLNHTGNVFGTVVTPDSDVFGLISSRLLAWCATWRRVPLGQEGAEGPRRRDGRARREGWAEWKELTVAAINIPRFYRERTPAPRVFVPVPSLLPCVCALSHNHRQRRRLRHRYISFEPRVMCNITLNRKHFAAWQRLINEHVAVVSRSPLHSQQLGELQYITKTFTGLYQIRQDRLGLDQKII